MTPPGLDYRARSGPDLAEMGKGTGRGDRDRQAEDGELSAGEDTGTTGRFRR